MARQMWGREGPGLAIGHRSRVRSREFAVYVWRSVRLNADTKTRKSRRKLEIPDQAAQELRQHHTRQAARQLKAGKA
ncbi:hypothetical protein ABGB08_33070 [Acrocarpospora sp. B8E8]